MTDAQLRDLLESARTIAVVGASTNPRKAAGRIPAILIAAGFRMIPVHPTAPEILGQRAYPTLADIPVPVDIVDLFRPSAETAGFAEQAVAIGARALWLQEGITSAEAERIATDAGLTFVQDRCIGETTRRLDAHPATSPDA